jgi:short-subunit dehydrogenase
MGAKLIITGRNSERLVETYTLLAGKGHLMKAMDLTNSPEVSAFVDELPKLDGIVHCAGTQKTCPVKFIEREGLNEIFETNFFSVVQLNTLLLSKKRIHKNASLVFISSTAAGLAAEYGNAMYSASKAQ